MANEIKENTDLTQEIKQNLLKTWKVFSSAPLTYFKSLWPALLVNCIGVAFFAVVFINFCSGYILPLYVLKEQTNLPIQELIFIVSPYQADCIILFLSVIALLVGLIIYQGISLHFSKIVIEEGNADPHCLYNNKTMWTYIKSTAIYLSTQLLVLLLFTVICALFVVHLSQWFFILFLILLAYWGMAYEQGSVHYILNKRSLRKIVINTLFFLGVNKKNFAAQIVSWTIFVPYALVAILPTIIIVCSYYYDTMGTLTGDASGLPPYMTILTFLIFSLTLFLLQSFYSLKKTFLSMSLLEK